MDFVLQEVLNVLIVPPLLYLKHQLRDNVAKRQQSAVSTSLRWSQSLEVDMGSWPFAKGLLAGGYRDLFLAFAVQWNPFVLPGSERAPKSSANDSRDEALNINAGNNGFAMQVCLPTSVNLNHLKQEAK